MCWEDMDSAAGFDPGAGEDTTLEPWQALWLSLISCRVSSLLPGCGGGLAQHVKFAQIRWRFSQACLI